jgi:hypothetical protein
LVDGELRLVESPVMGSGLKVPLAIGQLESGRGFTLEASSKLRSLATQDDFDLTPSRRTPLVNIFKRAMVHYMI